jgi:hypothetical protein
MYRHRNLRQVTLAAATLTISCWLTTGCSICAHPYDYSYTYYGARWQRSDMEHGRVGSAFYPAGEQLIHDPAPADPGVNPNRPAGNQNDPLQPKDGSAPTKSDEPGEQEEAPPPKPTESETRYRQDAQRAFGRR